MFYDCELLMLIDIGLKGVLLWLAVIIVDIVVADISAMVADTDKN